MYQKDMQRTKGGGISDNYVKTTKERGREGKQRKKPMVSCRLGEVV